MIPQEAWYAVFCMDVEKKGKRGGYSGCHPPLLGTSSGRRENVIANKRRGWSHLSFAEEVDFDSEPEHSCKTSSNTCSLQAQSQSSDVSEERDQIHSKSRREAQGISSSS